VALVLGGAFLFWRDHLGSLDDEAFVYLRYARNLHHGCGLRWNCGDTPVETFRSPAWLALVVLTSQVSPTFVGAAEACAAIALGAALLAALFFADQLALRTAAAGTETETRTARTRVTVVMAVGLALATDHAVLQDGVLGVDTPLLALVITSFAAAVIAGRPWLTVLALLAAALVRPECAVLGVALLFVAPFGRSQDGWTAQQRRILWLVLGGGLLLEVGVRFALFGDVVPNTFWALTGGTPRQATLGLGAGAGAFLTFPALALSPLVLLVPRARREATGLLGAFVLWMGVSLWTGGDALGGVRFASPLVPVCTAFAALGALALAERFLRPTLGPAAALTVAALLALRAGFHRQPPANGSADVHAHEQIALRIRRLAPGARIAAVPIGVLGLYFHSDVLDLIGLTRRDIALRRAPVVDMLDREQPEVIVTTVSGPDRFVSLEDVHPQSSLDRQIIEGVRSGKLRYLPVDVEVGPGAHWLILGFGSGAPKEPAP
jgi:hypothetical protein